MCSYYSTYFFIKNNLIAGVFNTFNKNVEYILFHFYKLVGIMICYYTSLITRYVGVKLRITFTSMPTST